MPDRRRAFYLVSTAASSWRDGNPKTRCSVCTDAARRATCARLQSRRGAAWALRPIHDSASRRSPSAGGKRSMFYFDPLYFAFLIPGLLLALFAQWRVKSTYAKTSQIPAMNRLTGAEVARRLLDSQGLYNVR